MRFKYLYGFLATQLYRLLHVFPNSDPIMSFVLPAAKNEKVWKAPLFAFFSMLAFDILTQKFGIWTIVTSSTYALIALAFTYFLKNQKASLKTYFGAGTIGVLAFDFITGPLMSTFLFRQSFFLTFLMQIPFTIMHLISVMFSIILITPLLDKQVMSEITNVINSIKNNLKTTWLEL